MQWILTSKGVVLLFMYAVSVRRFLVRTSARDPNKPMFSYYPLFQSLLLPGMALLAAFEPPAAFPGVTRPRRPIPSIVASYAMSRASRQIGLNLLFTGLIFQVQSIAANSGNRSKFKIPHRH